MLRASALPPKLARRALLLLTQHNYARAYLQPAEMFVTGVRPAQHLVEPCVDWALQLLRRPRFLALVAEDCGAGRAGPLEARGVLAQAVLAVLFDFGRLR